MLATAPPSRGGRSRRDFSQREADTSYAGDYRLPAGRSRRDFSQREAELFALGGAIQAAEAAVAAISASVRRKHQLKSMLGDLKPQSPRFQPA